MLVYMVRSSETSTAVSARVSLVTDENVITSAQTSSSLESPSTAYITVDPDVRGGVPCIGENQYPIAHILEKLAAGATHEQISQAFPGLTLADIQRALEAAAWVMRDPAIDWPSLNLPEMVDFQHEMQEWQSLSGESLDMDDSQH